MADIEIIKGADNGNPPDTLPQAYPKVNRNFKRINNEMASNKADIDNKLEAHKSSANAHPAQHIPYSGAVIGANNTKQAIDGLKQELNDLVLGGGDSNPEVVAARNGYDTLGDRLDASDTQLTKLVDMVKSPNVIQLVAHRGFAGVFPENTLAAFSAAIQLGADVVECDVQFTSDNVPVVIHDPTVDRTTNGTGDVNTFTLASIQSLDAGGWFAPEYGNARIPTLEDVIKLCRGKCELQIELKDAALSDARLELILNLVKSHNMLYHTRIISFDIVNLQNIRRLGSGIKLGKLDSTLPNLPQIAEITDCATMVHHPLISQSFVQEAKGYGLKVGAWTIGFDVTANVMIDFGVDMIAADYRVNVRG